MILSLLLTIYDCYCVIDISEANEHIILLKSFWYLHNEGSDDNLSYIVVFFLDISFVSYILLDVLRYVEGRKAYNIALSDGVYNKIKAAITENFMVSPEVEKEIEEVKAAIKAGHVLPLAELTAKRKKYKRDMLEGDYGYNPFHNYISSEKVERMKSKYPDRF